MVCSQETGHIRNAVYFGPLGLWFDGVFKWDEAVKILEFQFDQARTRSARIGRDTFAPRLSPAGDPFLAAPAAAGRPPSLPDPFAISSKHYRFCRGSLRGCAGCGSLTRARRACASTPLLHDF